jgi:hypothetical protein
MAKLRDDWNWQLYCALGYRVTEDIEELRCLNKCIARIIRQEKGKKITIFKK